MLITVYGLIVNKQTDSKGLFNAIYCIRDKRSSCQHTYLLQVALVQGEQSDYVVFHDRS